MPEITLSIPIAHCGVCGHNWTLRLNQKDIASGNGTKTVPKCARCQSSEDLSIVGATKNPSARDFVETATNEELKVLRDVLAVYREDFLGYRARILDMVGTYRFDQKKQTAANPVKKAVSR